MKKSQDQFDLLIKERVLSKIKDYPTRALVYNVIQLKKEQIKRKEIGEGQLDGSVWSPQNWRY